jgi:hypothetical protein
METRTREVPFSAPNALQAAVMGDWEDKLGPAKPAMASKPQIETYQVPVEKTRMVQQQVPKALPSLPEVDVPAAPSLSPSFSSAPPGLGEQFGMGLHGFEGFLGAMNARDPAAMDAINNAGMGYAANYAMGDGPYATMGTNDLQDKFGSQFGMDGRKSIAEGFKQDYGQISPAGRGVIEGGLKGLATGGPLGMLGARRSAGLAATSLRTASWGCWARLPTARSAAVWKRARPAI